VSVDLPAGGGVYTSTALQMVYDFITICVGVPSPEDDKVGDRTAEYLVRCRKVMQLLLSNDASSVGLHPAVYFYSWTGKQQPILFLTIAEIIVELERNKNLPEFIEVRRVFEEFLVSNRALLNQVIRKFGTKGSGKTHLKQFYDDVMKLIRDGQNDVMAGLVADPRYAYLQPAEAPYDGVAPTKYSTQVKSGLVMRELLPKAPRCAICGGYIPAQAISVDHKVRREDGGLATVDNAQLTHPYCNTGYKEWLNHKAKQSANR
jgi:HNH endonuclease